jgi:glycerol-3-phosphate dehydrogenase
MQRQATIDFYRQNPEVSVLIVGAGINGIGAFRDLTLQGVDALIVDKADFCSGSSAASTRLAHGGLRYLEHGDFRLVRESLLERNRLLQNAPHAVVPQPFTVPLYSWFSGILNAPLKFIGLLDKPSERGKIVVKVGMMFYDWFTRNNRMTPRHRMLSRSEALAKHKKLNPKIIGAATYYDSLMPYTERIGLEIALDAEADCDHAHALNYVSLVDAATDTVQLRDEISGETFDVKPRVVINGGGAWIDLVNQRMKRDTHYIGGTKGSHIIVDHPELTETLDGSAIYFENKDGRMCIMLPLKDKAIIGATDLRIDDPDEAVCSEDEIAYFLSFMAQVMPDIKIERSHVIAHFSGVRPLPYTDVEFTGLITREHSIRVDEPDGQHNYPIYSLVGGKWTTFRAFSEQIADMTLDFLKRSRQADTSNIPIGGGRDYPRSASQREQWLEQAQAKTGVAQERLETLFDRYGTGAEAVAAYIVQGEDKPLADAVGYSHREMMFVIENEKVLHLDDIVLRRSLIALLGLVNTEVLQQLGTIAGGMLGWSDEQIQSEVARAAEILITRNGVPAERLQLN